MELTTLLVAVLTVFVAQVVKGITGFGSALVTVPVLALLWGPREAVFVATAVDLFSGVFLAIPVRRLLRPWLIAAVFLPMVAGQWVGTDLLTTLPEGT
ncbi:MAG: TSUP family transporter, partial [Deltaproteobacteria bacterium]|nr:TSUP family transporter [Deltaproteobacteria bacterium]